MQFVALLAELGEFSEFPGADREIAALAKRALDRAREQPAMHVIAAFLVVDAQITSG